MNKRFNQNDITHHLTCLDIPNSINVHKYKFHSLGFIHFAKHGDKQTTQQYIMLCFLETENLWVHSEINTKIQI